MVLRRTPRYGAPSTGKVFHGLQSFKGAPTEVPPFPLESESGTFVPIYSSLRGRITKRNWTYHDPTWCGVCSEPIAAWLTHIGRKDHSLLDTHYDLIVDFPSRRWNPASVLVEVLSRQRLGRVGLEDFHRTLDAGEKMRRTDIANMIIFLTQEGVLEFSAESRERRAMQRSHWFGSNLAAHLVIHQFMIGPLMRMLPACDLPVLSNFEDFISSSYNLETVYDLCTLRAVDPDAEDHLDDAPTPKPGEGVTAASGDSADDANSGGAGEVVFSHKANFVKSVLGQLRWCVLHSPNPDATRRFPEHLEVVGNACVRALLAEMTTARISEYIVRSEAVWQRHGLERRKLMGTAAEDDPGLHASRWDATPGPRMVTYRSEDLTNADTRYTVPAPTATAPEPAPEKAAPPAAAARRRA